MSLPTQGPPCDEIRLEGLKLDAIIGINPEERVTPQPLTADVSVILDLTSAASSSELADTLDYSRMLLEMTYILSEGRFRLLESAAHTVLSHLLIPSSVAAPRVQRASVALSKPAVLGGTARPVITMTRGLDDISPREISSPAGRFLLLYEGPEVTVLRSIGPLASFSNPPAQPEPLELPGGGVLVVVRGNGGHLTYFGSGNR